jgi:rhodanese-related sulfurtransferase
MHYQSTFWKWTVIIVICWAAGVAGQESPEPLPVAGEVIDGYRVITIDPTAAHHRYNVYRGDYVKFKSDALPGTPELIIPDLAVRLQLSHDLETSPYVKMIAPGSYPFTLGAISGELIVVEYSQPNYREIFSTEAATVIQNVHPVILDVRTEWEYRQGHLENALWIPVQQLQTRIHELAEYKNRDILVYCASGNRSTVASKVLIDNGFNRIYNLRDGMRGWLKNGLPVVK